MPETNSLLVKTRVFTIIVILTNVIGDSLLKFGMGQVGSPKTPLAYIFALFNPWVATGVCLLICWMISHMTLLSWADLSYVLPVTSVGYALVALAGRVFLHESVSPLRWSGIVLIVLGVFLVGRTEPNTREPHSVAEEVLAQ